MIVSRLRRRLRQRLRRASPSAPLLALALAAAALARPGGAAGTPDDAASLLTLREGLVEVVAWSESSTLPFAQQDGALPRRADREQAWGAWSRFLDHQVALEELAQRHEDWWRRHGPERARVFAIARTAHLARYGAALRFIEAVERSPTLPALLDDAVPELGLPAGTYSELKSDVLEMTEAGEWLAWSAAAPALRCADCDDLAAAIEADMASITRLARGRGGMLTLRNAGDVVRSLGRDAWFPVQARTAEWMGDTKVRRRGESLVTREQARDLAARLQPGDILLTRREWYVSNVGLPGYWSHAALYVGTPDERRAWSDDEEVRAWVRSQGRADGSFEALLAHEVPHARRASLRRAEEGPRRVLEAVSEGVSFSAIEHAAECDSVAVLRPRLGRAARAAAVLRAFRYAGRPYDYDFDFRTDSALVCTELACKAYEGSASEGLSFPLQTVMGRPILPANDIARHFDQAHGTPSQQLDLVAFLDGSEATGAARECGLDEFRATWRRPKWHVVRERLDHR